MSNAILNLRTIDANIRLNNNTTFTWSNINLKKLLGVELYSKYNKFNLNITNIATNQSALIGVTFNDLRLLINIGSNAFENHNYNVVSGNNSGISSAICSFSFSQNNATISSYNNNSSITFNKENETIDINIFYSRIDGQAIAYAAVPISYPEVVFLFSITGIN